jgi:hypothetical protein
VGEGGGVGGYVSGPLLLRVLALDRGAQSTGLRVEGISLVLVLLFLPICE